MKQFLILLSAFLSLSEFSYSQSPCNLLESYGEFIKIERQQFNGKNYLIKRINKADDNCFSSIIKNDKYIEYLLMNFSSNENYDELLKVSDQEMLQKKYIESLKQDTLFNKVMTELSNKTIEQKLPKDSVTIHQLLNIAVKYFSILKINGDGHYVGKVCVGINDIKKTEKIRQPQLEAFCFSSILKNYKGDQYNIYEEFIKSLKELYDLNLGVAEEERLLRAQGGMFFLMKNNENLKNMLLAEYQLKKNILPFVIK